MQRARGEEWMYERKEGKREETSERSGRGKRGGCRHLGDGSLRGRTRRSSAPTGLHVCV